jgi:hypothetical protein
MPPRRKQQKAISNEEKLEVVTTKVVDSDSDSDRESDVKVIQDSDSDSEDEPKVVMKVTQDSDSDSEDEPKVVKKVTQDSDSDSEDEPKVVKKVTQDSDSDSEDEPKVVKKVTQKKKAVPKAKAKAKVEEKEGSDEEVTKRHVMSPIERIDLVIKKMAETGTPNTKDIMNQMMRLRKQLDGAKIKQATTSRAPNAYNLWMKEWMAKLKDNGMDPKKRFAECIRLWNEDKKLKLEAAQ